VIPLDRFPGEPLAGSRATNGFPEPKTPIAPDSPEPGQEQ
jgi:hypothetical protein